MTIIPQLSPNALVALIVVTIAMVVDVRVRRIPNVITLPGIFLGLVFWVLSHGWTGVLLGVGGAVVSPFLLVLLRAGNRPGMGDVKLVAAVGSLLGPAAGGVTVLASAAIGGLIAIVWMLKPGTAASRQLSTFFVGIPFLAKLYDREVDEEHDVGRVTIPYGLAIGLGTFVSVGTLCCR